MRQVNETGRFQGCRWVWWITRTGLGIGLWPFRWFAGGFP